LKETPLSPAGSPRSPAQPASMIGIPPKRLTIMSRLRQKRQQPIKMRELTAVPPKRNQFSHSLSPKFHPTSETGFFSFIDLPGYTNQLNLNSNEKPGFSTL
jgi:hypothetical protein